MVCVPVFQILTAGIAFIKEVFAVPSVDEIGKAMLVCPEVPRTTLLERISESNGAL